MTDHKIARVAPGTLSTKPRATQATTPNGNTMTSPTPTAAAVPAPAPAAPIPVLSQAVVSFDEAFDAVNALPAPTSSLGTAMWDAAIASATEGNAAADVDPDADGASADGAPWDASAGLDPDGDGTGGEEEDEARTVDFPPMLEVSEDDTGPQFKLTLFTPKCMGCPVWMPANVPHAVTEATAKTWTCHPDNGLKVCPSSYIKIVIDGPRKKALMRLEKARTEGTTVFLAEMAAFSGGKLPEEDKSWVLEQLGLSL